MRIRGGRVPTVTIYNMLRTRDVLKQAIKSGMRKRITAQQDYYFGNGHSRPFVQVDMKITNACNLRCKMCGQWGEAGWHLTMPSSVVGRTVPLNIYKKMVDDISGFKPWIYIWGGEPFLYRPLLPLLRYMKEHQLITSVVTNGNFLEEHAKELVEIECDVIMLSIDGPKDTHDNIRGHQGAFDKTLSGMKAIQRERISQGGIKPYLVIMATVSKDNAACLDEVFKVAEEYKADGLVAYYAWFQTEESVAKHDELMTRKLDGPWAAPKGWIWSYDQIDTGELVESVRRIKARTWNFPYLFAPELKLEDIPTYYKEHGNLFGYGKCVTPWTTIEIGPNGEVATCRDYPDYQVGNIRDQGIMEIWNNERYQKFRTTLKEERLFPICSRCCQLMGW
jgi:radical SAM protein with 4Fe4S-binding SPASM domain